MPSGERILNPGEKLGGFQILEVVGAGGMAVVYKALQLSLNRPVALKVLNSRFSRDPAFIQRFEQEAGALAALNHPNIVNIIDKGQAENLYYFVMEFVQGTSLDKAIIEGTLTLTDYMIIIMGIRDALAYVHSRGIVHRDIKPANILLSDEGRVKVSDFGIAHIAWGDPKLQKSGKSQFGTSFYMAPEQAEKGMKVDARTDIYALGVAFYKMFTREIPQGTFAGPSTINPTLPADVDPILEKALQGNPDNRYQSVEAFCNDLVTVLWAHSGLAEGDAGFGVTPAGTRNASALGGSSPFGPTPLPIPSQPTSTFPSLTPSGTPPARTRKTPSPVPSPVSPVPAAPSAVRTPPEKPGKKETAGSSRARGKWFWVAAVLVVLAAAGGGYVWFSRFQAEPEPSLAALGTPGPEPTGPGEVVDRGTPPSEGSREAEPSAAASSHKSSPPAAPVAGGPVAQELVSIPAGPVRIGEVNSLWASPPRVVNLPAFQIEKYEVTNWMYAQFIKETGHPPPPYWRNGSIPGGREDYPVVEVTLDDALAYAKWAGRDLPTEEQWERAARGANGWTYPWGMDWIEGATNIQTGQMGPVNAPGWRDQTRELQGEGCVFMAGNVMEWTQSRFTPYPGALDSSSRFSPSAITIRGGACVFRTRERVNPIFMARAGARAFVQEPEVRLDNLGFRCVVNTAPKVAAAPPRRMQGVPR